LSLNFAKVLNFRKVVWQIISETKKRTTQYLNKNQKLVELKTQHFKLGKHLAQNPNQTSPKLLWNIPKPNIRTMTLSLAYQKTTHITMPTTKPIGGFFELELPAKGSLYHDAALPLANGRVCFKAILDRVKPTKVYLPFYSSDSLLAPLKQLNIPFEFYALNSQLEPTALPVLGEKDLLLYINYFGLKSKTVQKIVQLLGEQAVIDNAQAFFEQSYFNSWSFNSARKFFGVPDGGFLYSPQYMEDKFTPNKPFFIDHLWLRLLGKQEEANKIHQQNEENQTLDIKGMSHFTRQILYTVDYSAVTRARKRHYRLLDRALRELNTFSADFLELPQNAVPFCYPFLPKKSVSRDELNHNDIYLTDLWQEVLTRNTEGGYQLEKSWANRLLPLPIDHRLEMPDLQRMIDTIKYLAG
jgi:hypothetical protein